jgi:hypothetical protein
MWVKEIFNILPGLQIPLLKGADCKSAPAAASF